MRRSTLLVLLVGCQPSPVAESRPSEPSLQHAVAPAAADAPTGPETTAPTGIESDAPPVRAGSPEPAIDPPPSDTGNRAPVVIGDEPWPRAQLPEPDGKAKASRVRPGEYQCKISRGYRFRPCTVELDEHGRTILTIPHALLGLEGVLVDQGQWTHFDGIKTRDRPFGCFACDERCTTNPESCACQELPRVASAQCLLEPVRFRFRKEDGQWRGLIEHHHYYGDLDPEDGRPLYETNRYPFVMRR